MCRTNKIAGQEEVKIHQAVNDSVMKNLTEEVSDKMIGCLCWFDIYNEKNIGILTKITKLNIENSATYYIDDGGHFHLSCRPVKPDEVKFYKDNK